jgi:hypothetical protein
MSLNTQEFTDAGRTMLGRAQAGETLTVSKIVVGSGSAAVAGDLWPLTALITHEMDVAIFSKVDDGEGTLTVEGSFNAETAPRLFELRELGVMAHIGAEADQLYSIANVFTDAPDLIDPASTGVHAFKIKLVIERATNVTVTFGTSTDILAENIGADTVGPGWYKEKILNTLRFKRAVAGTDIELVDDGDTVMIGVKTLTVDLDLYVPSTHPDAPSPDVTFDTIQEAFDYLLQYHIPTNRFATIHVAAGTFTVTTPISVTHPNGSQIRLIGAVPLTTNVSTITNLDATKFNVVVASATGLAVNDLVTLAGTSDSRYTGGHNITAIVGNTVTLGKRFEGGTDYTTSATGGQLIKYPCKLAASVSDIIIISSSGLNRIENFTFSGAAPYSGITVRGPMSVIRSSLCWGFQIGFWAQRGTSLNCENLTLTANVFGMVVEGGATIGTTLTCWLNGNTSIGAWVRNGGDIGFGAQTDLSQNATLVMGNGTGLQADKNATVSVNNSTSCLNSVAFKASDNATFIGGANTAYSVHSILNASLDGLAQNRAYMRIAKNGGTFASCSPASGTVGNNQAFLLVQ